MDKKLETISTKLGIQPRIAKQILANEELTNQVLTREVLPEHLVVEEYQIPLSVLKTMRSRNQLSFFSTKGEIDVSTRGSKIFYFLDELQAIFSYNVKYSKSHVFRYNLMNRALLEIAKLTMSNKEAEIIDYLYVQNLSIEEISDKLYISSARVTQMINKAIRRLILRVGQLSKDFKEDWEIMRPLERERTLLQELNKQMYLKFEGQKLIRAKEVGELNQLTQHFLEYNLDISLIEQNIHELPLYKEINSRTRTLLSIHSIVTVRDLLSKTKRELIRTRNVGTKTIKELEELVWEYFKWEFQ